MIKKTKKFIYKWEKYLSIIMLFMVILIVYNSFQKESNFFLEEGKYVIGTVVGYEGSSNVKYSFELSNKTYVSSYHEGLYNVEIGEKYLVLCDSVTPTYSIIFFHKKIKNDTDTKYNITERDFNLWYRFGLNNFLDTKYIIQTIIGSLAIGIVFFSVRKIYLFILKKYRSYFP